LLVVLSEAIAVWKAVHVAMAFNRRVYIDNSRSQRFALGEEVTDITGA
jgi:hypothetical protein